MMRLAAVERAAAAPPPWRSSGCEQARVLRYLPRARVAAGRWRLEIEYPPAGLVDHLVELLLANGDCMLLRLPVTRRNHVDGMIELESGLAELRLHVSGSGRLDRAPRLRLNPWPEHEPAPRRHVRRLWRALVAERLGFAVWLAGVCLRRWRREPAARDADARWRALFDEHPERDAALHRARLARLTRRPVFGVVALPGHDAARLAADLSAQIYPRWRLLTGPDRAGADFILFHRAGLRLRPHALLEMAIAAELFPEALLLYADHAIQGGATRGGGHNVFKPAWSPALFAHSDYLGAAACFSTRLPGTSAGQLRRLCAGLPAGRVVHIPRVLSYQPEAEMEEPAAGGVAPAPPASASLIIPTRDRAALLASCIRRVLATTRGQAVEIIIIDNGSAEPDALRLLDDCRRNPAITVLRQPGGFNYSALCNAGAAAATGEVLVFLNNDVEPLAEDWLAQLMAPAMRDEVGCVGALLLYPDGTLQHAGVVLGIDDHTAHRLRGAWPDDPALSRQMSGPRETMAVTGACLAVRRALFHEAGGFDAASLPVSYNDIDLCLKVAALGYRNLWAPGARLLHHESASRGRDSTPEQHAQARREHRVMQQRWRERMMSDPYYSPNLTIRADTMAIRER